MYNWKAWPPPPMMENRSAWHGLGACLSRRSSFVLNLEINRMSQVSPGCRPSSWSQPSSKMMADVLMSSIHAEPNREGRRCRQPSEHIDAERLPKIIHNRNRTAFTEGHKVSSTSCVHLPHTTGTFDTIVSFRARATEQKRTPIHRTLNHD